MTDANKIFNDDEINKINRMKSVAITWMHNLKGMLDPIVVDNGLIVIAGGAFASVHHNELQKDIDIFILDDEPTQRAIMQWLWEFPKKDINDTSDYVRVLNNNVRHSVTHLPTMMQFVFTKYKTREELISHFDMQHCTVSYNDGKLYISRDTYDCIDKRIAKSYSGKTVLNWRKAKMTKAGWTWIDKGQKINISNVISVVEANDLSQGKYHTSYRTLYG